MDEVELNNRASCVKAINSFIDTFGLPGLVVCSRLEEYIDIPVRLKLNAAICIQSLTHEQVYDYLSDAGSKLESLLNTLKSDESLLTLAQSPLMLNVMSLAYQDVEVSDDLIQNDIEIRKKNIFNAYIDKMLIRKGQSNKAYTPEKTIIWLSWLAQRMNENNQTIFLIENMQPNWLQNRLWKQLYMIGSRMFLGFIGGVVYEIAIISLIIRLSRGGIVWSDKLFYVVIFGLIFGLFCGLMYGLILGHIDFYRLELKNKTEKQKESINRSSKTKILITTAIFSIMGGIGIGYIGKIIGASKIGLIFGLLFSITFFVIVYGLNTWSFFQLGSKRNNIANDIQTIETLKWSWRKGIKGGLWGGCFGLLIAFGYGFLFWYFMSLSSTRFVIGFGYGFLMFLIGFLFGGLDTAIVEAKSVPNQGVLLSLKNAILIGLTLGLSVGIIFSFNIGLGIGILFGLKLGIIVGAVSCIITMLWCGGFDIVKHYFLRLILYLKGNIAFNYSHFLDESVKNILLQKVGGGYIFIHRLLLEHFADQNIKGSENEKSIENS